jgi:hypothetical protein
MIGVSGNDICLSTLEKGFSEDAVGRNIAGEGSDNSFRIPTIKLVRLLVMTLQLRKGFVLDK